MEEEAVAVGQVTNSRSQCCWNKRTALEKFLFCAIILVVVVAVSVGVLTHGRTLRNVTEDKSSFQPRSTAARTSSGDSLQTTNTCKTICNTKTCVKVAYRIISNMDESIDPCEDFHQYACGGWEKRFADVEGEQKSVMVTEMADVLATNLKRILETENSEDDLKAFKDARSYYESCKSEEDIEKLGFPTAKDVLNEIGTIYENETDWKKADVNFTTLLYELLIRNGPPLFDVNYEITSRNSSRSVVSVSIPAYKSFIQEGEEWKSVPAELKSTNVDDKSNQPETNSSKPEKPKKLYPSAHVYKFIQQALDEEKDKNMYDFLQKYFDRSANNTRQKKLENELKAFMSKLRKIIPLPKVLSGAKSRGETDKTYKIRELYELLSYVEWKTLFEMLFKRPFSDDDIVQLSYPPYFEGLQELISNTSLRIVNNVILSLFARDILWELANYDGADRWKFCVDATKAVYPIAISAMYKRNFSSNDLEEMRHQAEDLYNDLKNSFKTIVLNNKWMDSKSKKNMLLKLSNMSGIFINPPALNNDTYIELDESTLELTGNFLNDTISSYILSREDLYDTNLADQKSFDEEMSLMINTNVINAFHITKLNWIAVPLGILTPPNYIEGQPRYITYGGIGSTVAHEISHGFDASGIRHDQFGENQQWMTSETENRINERIQCYVDTYSDITKVVSFRGLNVEVNVDGNFTLDENLSDNYGHEIAYQAYQDWVHRHGEELLLPGLNLTREQIYFINEAQSFCSFISPLGAILTAETDEHSPDHERINTIMKNSDVFAQAFQCPVGSPMNPVPKCTMW